MPVAILSFNEVGVGLLAALGVQCIANNRADVHWLLVVSSVHGRDEVTVLHQVLHSVAGADRLRRLDVPLLIVDVSGGVSFERHGGTARMIRVGARKRHMGKW